jgi:hypothetical protein
MLPEAAFGVWFSEFNPFTASDYENQLIPAFEQNNVPLDYLVVDTDWKSPQQWDGWNWNPNLFPDPQSFLDWAKQHHLNVTLNVHAGIDASDPKFAATQQTAGGALQRAAQCFSPTCYRFDWSDPAQAKAWFDLHQPFEQQGVRQWWLDWCCTDSIVSMAGLTPDMLNELYAQDLASRATRVQPGPLALRSRITVGPRVRPLGRAPQHRRVHGRHRPDLAGTRLCGRVSCGVQHRAPYVSNDIGSLRQAPPRRSLRPVGAARNVLADPAAAFRPR